MSDAYDKDAFTNGDHCGCGAGLSPCSVRVIHAETGELVTRLCRRCAADLVPLPAAADAGATAGKTGAH
jgi:hypothetical protein